MSLKKLIASVDCGFATGAVALTDPNGSFAEVYDLPIVPKNGIDCVSFLDLLVGGNEVSHIVLEYQMGRPRQSCKSTFNLGLGYGQIISCCQISKIPYTFIMPTKWKKRMGLTGRPKEASIELAGRLYPSLRESHLYLKKHEHRSEALLIGKDYTLNGI